MRARSVIGCLAGTAVAASLLVLPAGSAAAETAPRPLVSGWFGWWASDTAIEAMTSESDGVVGEIAMFWWTFQGKDNPLCLYDNADYNKNNDWEDPLCDSATPWTTPKFDRQRKVLQAAGIKVNASITDLGKVTAGKLSTYLDEPKNRRAYAKKIADYAVKAGVDGIDLDWENFAFNDPAVGVTAADTRPRWIAMIKDLSRELRARNLTLWATVPGGVVAFSGDGSANDSTGYVAYAWSEIAPYVDRLNIMAYDYHWDVPGAIGPNDWARRVAESAVAQVGKDNASKVWIGAPHYGRNWPLKSGNAWVVDETCPAGWKPLAASSPVRTTVTPAQARDIAARENVEPTWVADDGEWTFQYWLETPGKANKKSVTCKVKREVWFADTRSALARATIVPEVGIGGIAVWEFNNALPEFYQRLADYGRELAPSATEVKVTAPQAVPVGSQARIRVLAQSRKGPAAGAEATLFFTAATAGAKRVKVATVTLSDAGRGTFRVPVESAGQWSVEVSGAAGRDAGTSAPFTIGVSLAVAATASTLAPRVNTSVTLSATVTPATAGVRVTLMRQAPDGTWKPVSTLVTDTAGKVTDKVRPTTVRKVGYQFVTAVTGQYAAGRSRVLTLDVQP